MKTRAMSVMATAMTISRTTEVSHLPWRMALSMYQNRMVGHTDDKSPGKHQHDAGDARVTDEIMLFL